MKNAQLEKHCATDFEREIALSDQPAEHGKKVTKKKKKKKKKVALQFVVTLVRTIHYCVWVIVQQLQGRITSGVVRTNRFAASGLELPIYRAFLTYNIT